VAGEQTVSLLDPVTQHLQWSTVVAAGCCREAAFAGNWLAAIGGDGLYVWEVTTGRQLYRLEDSAGQFATLALSPDGETLATGEFGQIRVWEARTGQERARWDTGDEGLSNWPLTAGITNLIFTPDGQRLYSANGWSGQVMEWEAASGELRTTLVFTNALHFAFTPDASQLLVEYNDYGFELHDPETGTLLARRAQIISAPGWLTFSGDGQRVAAWGYTTAQGNTAGVWELATETRLQEFSNGGSGGAAWTRAALNGDGSLLALSNERATMIYVFEVATGRQINAFPTP
jgi:WD40 repeat protein